MLPTAHHCSVLSVTVVSLNVGNGFYRAPLAPEMLRGFARTMADCRNFIQCIDPFAILTLWN